MKHTKTFRFAFAIVLTLVVSASGASFTVLAQEKEQPKPATKTPRGRDPFTKYVAPRVPVKKTGLIMPPSIQDRIAQYKAQKQAAMVARVAAPKPTTAFLLGELQVVGISRSPRGYAAIVEATPIKLAYVIYPGEKFYDGQLVAIEDNRLIFRRETVFADGRRERTVEMKPLRQATTVDVLASGKTQPAAEVEKTGDAKPATEKP